MPEKIDQKPGKVVRSRPFPGSVSKRVFLRNHSYENVFHLQVHFHANQTHFHMKGFARKLVLKQRHKVIWKWPTRVVGC